MSHNKGDSSSTKENCEYSYLLYCWNGERCLLQMGKNKDRLQFSSERLKYLPKPQISQSNCFVSVRHDSQRWITTDSILCCRNFPYKKNVSKTFLDIWSIKKMWLKKKKHFLVKPQTKKTLQYDPDMIWCTFEWKTKWHRGQYFSWHSTQ